MKKIFCLALIFMLSGCSIPFLHTESTPSAPTIPIATTDHTYIDTDNGFSIDYPPDWSPQIDQVDNSLIITGPAADNGQTATIKVKKLKTVSSGGQFEDAESVVAALNRQLANQTENPTLHGTKNYFYTKNGLRLGGKEQIIEFSINGQSYQEWQRIIPGPEGMIIYVWIYSAPKTIYGQYLKPAGEMAESYTIYR
ncbi:MAG: hypothetical protein ACOZBH_00650 [Patescibacteria group bacterium]